MQTGRMETSGTSYAFRGTKNRKEKNRKRKKKKEKTPDQKQKKTNNQ